MKQEVRLKRKRKATDERAMRVRCTSRNSLSHGTESFVTETNTACVKRRMELLNLKMEANTKLSKPAIYRLAKVGCKEAKNEMRTVALS